jgi:flagellar hook-associated protein 3 FlgL
MRVTTAQAQRSQLDYIQGNLQRFVKAQDQAATGRRFQRASEDPAATADVLRADGTLAANAQHLRNGDQAIGRANEEDRVLNETELLLQRARELSAQQIGSTSNAATRLIAKAEVDQLVSAAVALGNTRYDEGYLFGGTRSTQAPLANTPNSVPPFVANNAALVNPQFEIAPGVVSSPNHNAHEMFRDTNALVALRDLSNALGADDTAGISAALPALETASNGVGALLGEIGARVNRYETVQTATRNGVVDTRARRSVLFDIDLAEASANFAQAQVAYQAALSAANRVINLNVMDYLR